MSKRITVKSLKGLVETYNEACKQDKSDERPQEKRRALLAIRRAINGDDGVSDDQLVELAQILSDAERNIAEKLTAMKLEMHAMQRLQLADDIDEIVLEIVTVEEEPVEETTKEVNGNIG